MSWERRVSKLAHEHVVTSQPFIAAKMAEQQKNRAGLAVTRTLRSAPAQKVPATEDVSTRQRLVCSLRILFTASRSSRNIWHPNAFFASGLSLQHRLQVGVHQTLQPYSAYGMLQCTCMGK